MSANVLTDTAYPVGRQDRHFLFLLVLSVKKGKKRNNEAAKGNQQCQYANDKR